MSDVEPRAARALRISGILFVVRFAWWLLALWVLAGCGRPLEASRATVTTPPSEVGGKTAWLFCRASLPQGAIEIARYHGCRIVALDEPDAGSTGEPLGPAEHLRKVDPAVLVKAMARYDELHVVARYTGDIPQYPDPSPRIHEQVGCRSRGFEWDLDCPHAAIPALLAHPQVETVTPWNRPYVRWR